MLGPGSDFEAAIESFDAAGALNDSALLGCVSRALESYQWRDYRKVLEDLSKAVEIVPDPSVICFLRGIIFLNQKEYQPAIEDFTRCAGFAEGVGMDPYCKRGMAHYFMRNFDAAQEDFDKEPHEPRSAFFKGEIRRIQKDHAGAVEEFTRSIQLGRERRDEGIDRDEDPEETFVLNEWRNANAYFHRGLAKYDLNDHKGAAEDLIKAMKLDISRGVIFDFRDAVLDDETAVAGLSKVIDICPQWPDAYYMRARINQYPDPECRYRNAFSDIFRALEKVRDCSISRYTDYYDMEDHIEYLAVHFLHKWFSGEIASEGELIEPEVIAEYLDFAVGVTPYIAIFYYFRGRLRFEFLADFPGAIADFDSLAELEPDDWFAVYKRGEARFRSGDLKGARSDYRMARRMSPDNEKIVPYQD